MNANNDHPWLRPLWRRVAIVAFCVAWSAFEFYNGEGLWGGIAGAMAVYGAWMYLIDYKPAPDATTGATTEASVSRQTEDRDG